MKAISSILKSLGGIGGVFFGAPAEAPDGTVPSKPSLTVIQGGAGSTDEPAPDNAGKSKLVPGPNTNKCFKGGWA